VDGKTSPLEAMGNAKVSKDGKPSKSWTFYQESAKKEPKVV